MRAVAEVVLFHHAQGLTPGMLNFAERLRRAEHVVHAPDLYEGRVFDSVDDGVAYARKIGFGTIIERGRQVADGLPAEVVYAGFSLGVMPAQLLTQTRPGAKGALLLEAFVPVTEFSESWPAGVPVQIHGMDSDPSFAGEGDLDAARDFVASTPEAELFLYPGRSHLFVDDSLPSYDATAAGLLTERAIDFLARLDPRA